MNSNPRNSLDYQGAQLEQLSDVSLLEVMQEKTDEETSTKYVLIKHDFYSSDSDHGRELLSGFVSFGNSPPRSLIVSPILGTRNVNKPIDTAAVRPARILGYTIAEEILFLRQRQDPDLQGFLRRHLNR